jgi:hypothetical protein
VSLLTPGDVIGPHAIALESLAGDTGNTNDTAAASVASLASEISWLSQELIMKAPRDMDTVKSLQLIRSQLDALVTSAASNGPQLPERETLGPNQLSWPETAARIVNGRGIDTPRGRARGYAWVGVRV